jgi:hypothetical protein
MFCDRVKMLDFSASEVHPLGRFIRWAGLENRFLSRMVTEHNTLRLGSEVQILIMPEPEYDIRAKVHALTRVAATLYSPRFERDPQKGLEMWETDGICSTLMLHMDGVDIAVDRQQGDICMGSPLKIFLPLHGEAMDARVRHALLERLARWLMDDLSHINGRKTDPLVHLKAANIVAALLEAKPESISWVLETYGILDINITNEDDIITETQGTASQGSRIPETQVLPPSGRPVGSLQVEGSLTNTTMIADSIILFQVFEILIGHGCVPDYSSGNWLALRKDPRGLQVNARLVRDRGFRHSLQRLHRSLHHAAYRPRLSPGRAVARKRPKFLL